MRDLQAELSIGTNLLLSPRSPMRSLTVTAAHGPDDRGFQALVRHLGFELNLLVITKGSETISLYDGLSERMATLNDAKSKTVFWSHYKWSQ